MQKVLVQVSDCCKASVVLGIKREFPLGGSTWYQSFRTYGCEKCCSECEAIDIEVCEYCGEEHCNCEEEEAVKAAFERLEVI